jgi:hypothetical protein
VNAPRSWPNSSLSIGQRAAIDGDERKIATTAEIVKRPRGELLSGAGLPLDQHRRVDGCHSLEQAQCLGERRRAAEQIEPGKGVRGQ